MGLRGPKARGQEDWMIPVAELMVQEHMSFSAACQALGQKFDNSASERAAQWSEPFQNILNALNYKFYAQIGDNPLLTKGVILGVLMTAMRRLAEQESWEKVAIPAKLVSDIMGLTDRSLADKPVIANLTQADIDRIRKELAEQEIQEEDVKNAVDFIADRAANKPEPN